MSRKPKVEKELSPEELKKKKAADKAAKEAAKEEAKEAAESSEESSEEVEEEEEEKEEPKKDSKKVCKLYDRNGKLARVYSLELHGKDYKKLAEGYARKKGFKVGK